MFFFVFVRVRLGSPQDSPLKQERAARLEERSWAAASRWRRKVSGSLIDQKREKPVYYKQDQNS